MADDRNGFTPARRSTLPSLLCVSKGRLPGTLASRQTLDRHRQAGVVHHGEHQRHALVQVADQFADGAAIVAVGHDAGRAGVDADLSLQRDAAQIVASAGRTVGFGQKLRHDEQRDALAARRRIRRPGQHEMNDVLGQVVLAIGDEDLLPADSPGVAVRDTARVVRAPTSQPAWVRSGSWCRSSGLRSAVEDSARAGPAMPCVSRASIAPCVNSAQSEKHRLAAYHISWTRRRDRPGQALPAPGRFERHALSSPVAQRRDRRR